MGLLLGLTLVVGLSKTSLFLMFNVINKRDDVLDAADNNNRDDAGKKSINNHEDMFDAVEDDGDDLDTNKRCLWTDLGFFRHFDPDLPFFFSVTVIFGGVDVFFFVMVLSTNDS
jgi:hypothetical protein